MAPIRRAYSARPRRTSLRYAGPAENAGAMHSALTHASLAFWFLIRAGFLLTVLVGFGVTTGIIRAFSRRRITISRHRGSARSGETAPPPRHGIRLH
jgi:hypothetical protein